MPQYLTRSCIILCMLARRGDEPDLPGPAPAPADSRWPEIVLPLVWLVLLIVPVCLLGYAFRESFYLSEGTKPPKAQLDRASAAAVACGIVLLVTPLAGWAVAAGTRHRVQAWLFGIIFIAASFIACALILYATHRHR
jgi:hypothetical protein